MNALELRLKFESDLKTLQDNCPHTESEEMLNSYAPGHFTGMVRVCKNCDKNLNQ